MGWHLWLIWKLGSPGTITIVIILCFLDLFLMRGRIVSWIFLHRLPWLVFLWDLEAGFTMREMKSIIRISWKRVRSARNFLGIEISTCTGQPLFLGLSDDIFLWVVSCVLCSRSQNLLLASKFLKFLGKCQL